MKFFWHCYRLTANIKFLAISCVIILTTSCATYHEHYGKQAKLPLNVTASDTDTLEHRFYLVGDAGYASQPNGQRLLDAVSSHIKDEGKKATLMYMGDNIYPLGMPKEGHKGREEAEASLNAQLKLAELFKGKTYFIPGNHDWYHGLDGLKEQEKLVVKALGKDSFLPGKGCGINDVKITDNITMVVLDSEWFIENWDDYPTMNDDCTIKTREAWFAEIESLLNKNQDKTILLAVHHPVMSNGAHGGQLSARKELYPLHYNVPMPVLGSLANLLRRTSGGSMQDLQSKVYREMASRIITLIQGRDNVVVISGHDHNLQYIEKNNVHQVISGAGSKEEAARAIGPNDFSFGGRGYAVLDVLKGGIVNVKYYRVNDSDEQKIFDVRLLEQKKSDAVKTEYARNFAKDTAVSIYTEKETTYGGFYKFLFGHHYRKYYSTKVKAPVAILDTLYGGFTVDRAGGGHQSNSLRMINKNGKEYVMRAMRKSATRFLQSTAFRTQYIGDDYNGTFAESFLLDFYTTAHPYTPFIIDDLEESVGIYHTNPELFYIPKQEAIGKHNDLHGDALYMVEERPTDDFTKLESFGKPDGIDGTDDVYEKLRKSKKNVIDEKAYIRVRLFDMIVGDWDRHADQWRWAKFKTPDSTYYRPIPRDRDQAFPKYGGALLSVLMNIPPLRYMRAYSDDVPNVKWQMKQGYTQDVAFITKSTEEDWIAEAKFLQEHLTDKAIDDAFAQLPPEVIDGDTETIKHNLKSRRDKLLSYVPRYRKVLLKTVLLTGTDKKEKFVITRQPHGITRVEIFSQKKEGDSLVFSHSYNKKQTKELWLYGLDDDDTFEVQGKPSGAILLRLIGGQNNDTYVAENARRVKIYDFKTKKNTYEAKGAALKLTNDYETNLYDPKKPNYNIFAGYPSVGYNPDDGVKLGVMASYTVNNFNRRPYSRKYAATANYYFATQGFELIYRGTFMNVASKWNVGLDARYTSPNFSINYFGMGNETVNHDDELGMDFNRVKLQVFRVSPSLFREGRNGSFVELKADFETLEVDGSLNRYVNQPGVLQPYLFEHRQYAGVQGTYRFENYDNKSLPALGMNFYATAGWKASMDIFERNFAHAETGITFYHKITRDEKLVYSTTFKGKFLFNGNYEFYQAMTLGGDNDLRGYRRERFAGRSVFYNSNDLRYKIGDWKSSFIPMSYGILGGYDYGRVWLPGENSDKWHQSAGGGLWLNGANTATAYISCFYGSDGARVAFKLAIGL